jgi:hypothetical protein
MTNPHSRDFAIFHDLRVFVVFFIGSFAIRGAPRQVLMDTRSQLVMIGKLRANALALMALDLVSRPFTILTSLRDTKWDIGQTNKPLWLIFCLGTWPT